jgi:hypothetical protein
MRQQYASLRMVSGINSRFHGAYPDASERQRTGSWSGKVRRFDGQKLRIQAMNGEYDF